METQNGTDSLTEGSPTLLGLSQGPRGLEISVSFGGRTLKSQHLERASEGSSARGSIRQLALLGGATLALAAALFAWRLSEVRLNLRHQEAMKSWARTHIEAVPFIPSVTKRPFMEAAVLLLTAGGILAGLLAFQKHRTRAKHATFTVGEDPRCDFPTPDARLGLTQFPLVQAHSAGFRLMVAPSMKGGLELAGGGTLTLEQAAGTPAAYPHPELKGMHIVDLPPQVRCWVEMGPMTVTIEDSEV
jgi:hypothetical protein